MLPEEYNQNRQPNDDSTLSARLGDSLNLLTVVVWAVLIGSVTLIVKLPP